MTPNVEGRVGKKPLVVLVPDTFGSHLKDKEGRVWLDAAALAAGAVDRLAMDRPDVRTGGVNAALYRPLVDSLATANEVEAFDYDWRRSARASAAGLWDLVGRQLEGEPRPLHFVAHGAGGLVVLAMLADQDNARERLRESRFVLLGTPFGGSWEVVRMLEGKDPLARHVEKLEGSRPHRFPEILRECPGLLEQLPSGAASGAAEALTDPGDWYRPEAWGEVPPPAPALGEALEFRRWLTRSFDTLLDRPGPPILGRLLAVAGVGVPTCADARLSGKAREFLFTAAGDGRVLAAQVEVKGARCAHVDASHADLIRSDDLRTSYREALEGRDPVLLRRSSPPTADTAERANEEPAPEAPTQVDLAEAAIGALARKTSLVFPLRVRAAHGHLRQAKHPLAVGHYRDDSLVSAEVVLDEALDGALRQRLDVGAYPGPAGTVEVILKPQGHPPGAIVIGMGDVSDLSPDQLRRLFANAAVRHALAVAEGWGPGDPWLPAAFSSLLVGAGGGTSIALTESIVSIVGGALDANRRLRKSRALWDRVRIDEVEFVELFEDVAVQAARVVRELPTLMSQELRPSEEIDAGDHLDARPGGEFLQSTDPYRTGWWRRIEIRRQSPAAGGPTGQLRLQFTTMSDRARIEEDVHVQGEVQVAKLMTAAMADPTKDLKLPNALFELLVPAPVKDRIRQGGDLLLLLDAEAARYPFELMVERTDGGYRPLATSHGLLRQLIGIEGRRDSQPATGRNMLVIGAPRNVKPALNAASREAYLVGEMATARGYLPTSSIDTTSAEILSELYARDYRMLHVAAHGASSKNPLESGVRIDQDEFLTAANVQALPVVPELVFLNCCHTGHLGASSSLPELASSLAEGFIRAGARAVIAAGWAIDDDAALTFAREFYDSFLAGQRFGDAVRAAREKVHRTHQGTNTWGAYQCYGSPDYRLPEPAHARGPSRKVKPVSRGELIAALKSLAARAGGASDEDARALAKEFLDLRAFGEQWQDGGVLAESAAVAAELEDFEEAAKLYDNALRMTEALAPISAIEQLANILGRRAPGLFAPKTPDASAAAIDVLKEAQKWLNWLDKALEPTPERAALRGSLHKRWAMVTSGAERRRHLRLARIGYEKANELTKEAPEKKQSYQVVNWLALRYLTRTQGNPRVLAGLANDERMRVMQEERRQRDPDFWKRVAIPDAVMYQRLFEGALSDPEAFRDLEKEYARALKAAPTARQLASVCDQIAFLAEMVQDLRPQDGPTVVALERLRRKLLTR